MTVSKNLVYFDGETELEGLVVTPENAGQGPLPLVIISHPWLGIDDFVRDLGDKIAQMGYIVFAIDIYGKGVRGKQHSDGHRLKEPFKKDPSLLLRRLQLGYDQAMATPGIDPDKVLAIGHCFGGMCVLEMAKLVGKIEAIISVHGVVKEAVNAPGPYNCKKAFILNGAVDPLVDPGDLAVLQDELSKDNVDWTVINFGRGGHGFTNPHANGSVPGIEFDTVLNARTWAFITSCLEETLG
ncbi:dienelactone hydrolase family protein [Actibacterium lipolyticum]|uniref:Dienelactone hydrolase family protein n=1 Tax=Actibacterium lipolyticum TaxID=1524263 RepID=A0A238LA67_9RHOB|nr:dienelactone hydrolase family protein [Actibacterium lipolyticum]SMX51196.1 Dienelactone hydrolase family protein [Actibacterium lipolyticum]